MGWLCAVAGEHACGQLKVDSLEPRSVQVGQETVLRFHGAGFDKAVRIWTSFPGEVSIGEKQAGLLECRIKVPADVPAQVGALVLASPTGITPPVWLLIDEMVPILDSGANHRADQAQLLTLPATVSGQVDGAEPDYYAVELQQGQTLAVDVYTGRLGSACDPVVRVFDATGRELAFADDALNWGADARVGFVASTSGRYTIEVRDNSYRGGLPYVMRVGSFPLIVTCYPMGVQRKATSLVSVLTGDGVALPPLVLQGQDAGCSLVAMARLAAGGPPDFCYLTVSDVSEYLEFEPNDTQEKATRVALPCAINGIIQRTDDQDWFEFAAVAGQQWLLQSTGRTWGSPAYPYVRVMDASGKVIAESPISESEEIEFSFSAPSTGLYRVVVEELTGRAGPSFAYRLQIVQRPFAVTLKPVNTSRWVWGVPQDDGAVVLDVQCRRSGYDGPIAFTWDGNGFDGEFFQATLPEKANEGRVYWRPAAAAGSLSVARLLATASVGGHPWQTAVTTQRVVTLQQPALVYPPPWCDGLFVVGVTEPQAPLVRWKDNAPSVTVAPGGEATLQLPFERANGDYKEAPAVVLGKLPAGVELSSKVDKDTVQVTLKAKELAQGDYTIRLALFASFKGREQLAPVTLTLRVAPP